MDSENQPLSRRKLIGSIFLVSLVPAVANDTYFLYLVERCPKDYVSDCPGPIGPWDFLIWGFVVGVAGSLVGYVLRRDIWGVIFGGLLSGLILILSQIF